MRLATPTRAKLRGRVSIEDAFVSLPLRIASLLVVLSSVGIFVWMLCWAWLWAQGNHALDDRYFVIAPSGELLALLVGVLLIGGLGMVMLARERQ